jgi:hypothetical protein
LLLKLCQVLRFYAVLDDVWASRWTPESRRGRKGLNLPMNFDRISFFLSGVAHYFGRIFLFYLVGSGVMAQLLTWPKCIAKSWSAVDALSPWGLRSPLLNLNVGQLPRRLLE